MARYVWHKLKPVRDVSHATCAALRRRRSGEAAKWRSGEVAKWRSGEVAKWRSGKSAQHTPIRTNSRMALCNRAVAPRHSHFSLCCRQPATRHAQLCRFPIPDSRFPRCEQHHTSCHPYHV
ncbi:hypothetical protein EYR26_17645 [Xanthomonas oryzae]|nr:hypothetical protein EYR26_17645 [Xanthomonas oryzae]